MSNFPEHIDLVYLWVDGNDPSWRKRKNKALEAAGEATKNAQSGRYDDNEELRYSLRSVAQYLPWIRRIYIVTDKQIPSWLDASHPVIHITDHSEILPEAARPCFNSAVLDHYLHRIPGLSEYFLYANDDTFVNKPLDKSFFFGADGKPIVRFQRQAFQSSEETIRRLLKIRTNNYRRSITNARNLIKREFGKCNSGVLHHNIDAYRKSTYRDAIIHFKEDLQKVSQNQFRDPSDIQRILFSLYALIQNEATLKYVGRSESLRIPLQLISFDERIKKYDPQLFCINDTEYTTNSDRFVGRVFLNNYFPDKSDFENNLFFKF